MKNKLFAEASADLSASLRVVLATILLCGGAYPLFVYGVACIAAPESSSGSLLRNGSGRVVGSRMICQSFSSSGYFWPRPSAVDYNAAGAGGSNLSPASDELRQRAMKTVATCSADAARKLPADLASASGSGLDPDITLQAAMFQVPRVAHARHLDPSELEALVRRLASGNRPFWTGEGLVNVLQLNMAVDTLPQ